MINPNPVSSVEATLKERGDRYGSFRGHADITITFKNLQRGFTNDRGKVLTPSQQEALDMIFHKIGRIINGDPDYADSWHDIAGYAKLVEDELNARKSQAQGVNPPA